MIVIKLYVFLLFGFAQLLCISLANINTPYSDCLIKPTNVKIENFNVIDCTKKRCSIKTGEKAKLVIKFIADKDYKNIETAIYGQLNDADKNAEAIEVPWNKKKEACSAMTGEFGDGKSCKEGGLKKGNQYTFTEVIEILPEYPKVSVAGRLIIRERNARGSTTPLTRQQKVNWRIHPAEVLLCVRVLFSIV